MKKYYFVVFLTVIFILGFWYFKSGNTSPDSFLGNSELTFPEPDTTGLPQVYESDFYKFKINLPENFTVDEKHKYESTPTKSFSGVKFVIPESLSKGTNLSPDTYISIEKAFVDENSCSAQVFLDTSEPKEILELRGHKYTSAYTIGAGVGNRYEETVFATPIDNGCLAVRYFIHYSVFENYPEGTVKEFNKEDLVKLFDSIRMTLVLK